RFADGERQGSSIALSPKHDSPSFGVLSGRLGRPLVVVAAVSLLALAGCQSTANTTGSGGSPLSQTTQHGYVVSPEALEQVPVGSSRDQVLIALGSPSTTARYGNDVFYYISQTRYRAAAFMPEKVIDQRI